MARAYHPEDRDDGQTHIYLSGLIPSDEKNYYLLQHYGFENDGPYGRLGRNSLYQFYIKRNKIIKMDYRFLSMPVIYLKDD